MSRSRRLLIAALVGLATLNPIDNHGNAQPGPSNAQEKPREDAKPIDLVPIQDRIESVTSAIKSLKDNPDADAEKKRAERDLSAQEEMAKWAFWMFVAAVGTLLLTAAGVFLIWRTLVHTAVASNASKEMVDEARRTTAAAELSAEQQMDAFRRLERPYLFVEIGNTEHLRHRPNPGGPFLQLKIVNRGKLPALLKSREVTLYDCKTADVDGLRADVDEHYEVVAPGERSANMNAQVKGTRISYGGTAATDLLLLIVLEYEDPTGAIHTDRIALRGNDSALTFRIEPGPLNSRSSHYPGEQQDERT